MITKHLKQRLLGRRATQARLYAVSLIASLAVVTGCSEQKVQATRKSASPQALPAEVTNVQRRNLSETLNVVGSVAARETAQVRAEIAGTVLEIAFEEGQTVKKGQLLAKIDDSEISAQTEEAAAAFRLAELNLARAE
ncbi:MAG TPA: biotin/lipoyl-binding protein, partial [Opitutaceae bacterium]